MPSIRRFVERITGQIKGFSAEHPKRAQAILCSLIVLGIGLYTFVISDSNLGKQLRYSYRIQALTDECKRLEEAYQSNSLKIDSYKQNKASLEHIAREEYRMQHPDEVVFLIKDRPDSEDNESKWASLSILTHTFLKVSYVSTINLPSTGDQYLL